MDTGLYVVNVLWERNTMMFDLKTVSTWLAKHKKHNITVAFSENSIVITCQTCEKKSSHDGLIADIPF